MNVLPPEKQIEIIAALCEGVGQRAVSRLTGTDRKTVARLALAIGNGCAEINLGGNYANCFLYFMAQRAMTTAANETKDIASETASARFLRWMIFALFPLSVLRGKANDPHKALENLERASRAATALIDALSEIGITAWEAPFNVLNTNIDAMHILIGPKG